MSVLFVVGLALIAICFVLKVLFDIIEWLGLGGPSGEVPYEMIRASYGILGEINGNTGKMYTPNMNYIDGHFMATNNYDYDDSVCLDEYFK